MKKAFHIVYTILALNFFIPVISYAINPSQMINQFIGISEFFGVVGYPHSEDSVLWRVLAIANVITLGFLCVLLQVNLRRWYPCLLPLVFLKGMASLGFLVAYIVEPFPSYMVACLFDAVTVAAMWFFATRAFREMYQ